MSSIYLRSSLTLLLRTQDMHRWSHMYTAVTRGDGIGNCGGMLAMEDFPEEANLKWQTVSHVRIKRLARTSLFSKHYSFILSKIIRSYWKQQRGACYIQRCRGMCQPDPLRGKKLCWSWQPGKLWWVMELDVVHFSPKDLPRASSLSMLSHPLLHRCQHDLMQIPLSTCHSPTQKMTRLPILEEWPSLYL